MNLAKKRRGKGLTQQALADQIGVSRALVAQVEAGWRRPYPRFKRRAAEILGVKEEKLFR